MAVNETIRRYPRTADEAFRDASYAGSIHTPDKRIVGLTEPRDNIMRLAISLYRIYRHTNPRWRAAWLAVRDALRKPSF